MEHITSLLVRHVKKVPKRDPVYNNQSLIFISAVNECITKDYACAINKNMYQNATQYCQDLQQIIPFPEASQRLCLPISSSTSTIGNSTSQSPPTSGTSEQVIQEHQTTSKSLNTLLGAIIGGVVGGLALIIIIVLVITFVIIRRRKRRRAQEEMRSDTRLDNNKSGSYLPLPPGQGRQASNTSSVELGSISVTSSAQWDIQYEDLKIGKELGRGAYGIVYKGTWRTQEGMMRSSMAGKILFHFAFCLFY